tara:strand:+ start:1742 stop:3118 length:1377 start_codon:yes stop_codon:yes gene_type:complete
MQIIEHFLMAFAGYAWGPWLLILLIGGGFFFLLYSRFLPFRYFGHAVDVIRGKFDDPNDEGEVTHFQALSSALAGTIGLGNIGGVAIAIQTGGPGAIFWMWISAIVGVATKFFTCGLAIMYRGPDSQGHLQGGPMYMVVHGLGEKWRPLANFFCIACMIGSAPVFQVNQLVQILREIALPAEYLAAGDATVFNFICGLIVAAIVASVVLGGIQRIAAVASRIVPFMVALYVAAAGWILLSHWVDIPNYFGMIISDAFTGRAVAGGAIGLVIVTGIRRAAFSNEAGIGTEALAHGAAKTNEPTREGLVAMMGPIVDTLVICTSTAVIILSAGTWQNNDLNGVTLTAQAFEYNLPGVGAWLLVLCVLFFSTSTMFSFSYYGTKSLGFLIGAEYQYLYNYLYVFSIIAGAMASIDSVVNLIDGMFALMAIPTMVSSLWLAPRLMPVVREYFREHKLRNASA